MGWVLACDLGGTSFRAALVDADGRVGFAAALPMAVTSEVDPQLWWTGLRGLVEEVAALAGAAFDAVEAVAISGFTRSQVFLGGDGRVLRPAITWQDSRSEAHLAALLALLPVGHPERSAISAFHPLARLYFLACTEPEMRPAFVVDPKDFLNFRLTGRIAIDSVAGARMIASASLFEAAGLPACLPDVVAPTDIVGRVSGDHNGALRRLAGRPVVAMAHDSWACVLGLGAWRSGCAYNLSGTTEVLGVMSEIAAPAEGLLTVDWGGGLSQIGGPSQHGADTLVWLMRLIGFEGPVASGLDELLAQPRDGEAVLFLPYLQGERTPYWDPALRGAFVGLNRRHRAVDLAYAVLEGVAFVNRIVLGRAEAASGRRVEEIRFGGGGAGNARWCQIKADVTGRAVVVVDADEPGLVGAAIVGFVAVGGYASLAEAQARMVRPRARFTPKAEAVAMYDRLFGLFREAEQALAPVSRALAGLVRCPG